MSVESLRRLLCKKTIASTDFRHCDGALCKKCCRDGYCNIEHFNNKQQHYIDSDIHTSIYLKACPGSGKTEVLGVKCALEFEQWTSTNSGIAVLTFTNSAENEMRKRIDSFSSKGVEYPHFIGTFTSWLHGYIANPFIYILTHHGNDGKEDVSIRLVDAECCSDFLNAFKTRYGYGILYHIPANAYDWSVKTQEFLYAGRDQRDITEFSKALSTKDYMEKDLWDTKQKFWKAGFFTYADIEYLSCRLLKENTDIAALISKRFPTIIIDECQDLSYAELCILEELHKHGTSIHLIGDMNQAIYEFRLIDTMDTTEFIKNNQLLEMVLDENYRSNQPIVDVSTKIIHSTTPIVGKRELAVERPLIAILYKRNQLQQLVDDYLTILAKEGLSQSKSRIIVRNNTVKNTIQGHKDTNKTINTIEDFAHFVYLKKENKLTSFQESIKLLARAIQRTWYTNEAHESADNLYRPKSIERSEWNELIVHLQNSLTSDPAVFDLNKSWSEWKKALSCCLDRVDKLPAHPRDLKKLRKDIKDNIVKDCFSDAEDKHITIEIETIHGCKGMSLDSVLFVSSYSNTGKGSGAHWRDWFQQDETKISEAQRLAYVAFSRARHILALGIPNPQNNPITDDDKRMLSDYGFEIIDCGL